MSLAEDIYAEAMRRSADGMIGTAITPKVEVIAFNMAAVVAEKLEDLQERVERCERWGPE